MKSNLKEYNIVKPKIGSMFLSTCFEPKDVCHLHCLADNHSLMYKKFKNIKHLDGLNGAAIVHGKNASNVMSNTEIQHIDENTLKLHFGEI